MVLSGKKARPGWLAARDPGVERFPIEACTRPQHQVQPNTPSSSTAFLHLTQLYMRHWASLSYSLNSTCTVSFSVDRERGTGKERQTEHVDKRERETK